MTCWGGFFGGKIWAVPSLINYSIGLGQANWADLGGFLRQGYRRQFNRGHSRTLADTMGGGVWLGGSSIKNHGVFGHTCFLMEVMCRFFVDWFAWCCWGR